MRDPRPWWPSHAVAPEEMQPDAVCAYCGRKPVEPAWRPFCSERCKLADLGRWLAGDYRVPGPPLPPDQEDTE
jgi:uncharacterized protein